MFDTTSEIVFKDRLVAGGQEVIMRWPSDVEWGERARRTKILLKTLGRGIRESKVESGDTALKLFDRIKLNGAPTLTLGEATLIVEVLGKCSVTDVQLNGAEASVTLQVMGGAVTHHLKLPTADHVMSLKTAIVTHELPYGVQDIRIPLEPGARMYEACNGRSDDYNNQIPALHKDAALRAVTDYLERETSAANDAEGLF
jgi:hypothetical protein